MLKKTWTKMNPMKRRGTGLSVAAAAAATAIAAAAPSGPPASPGPVASASIPADGGAALRATLDAARTLLFADYKSIDARSGLAGALSARLDIDEANLFSASMPSGGSAAQFWDRNAAVVSFDRALVDQLAAGKADDLASVRGLDDIPLRSAAAGVLAPCAIDVPAAYDPLRPAPLVVLLHPQSVSEADEAAEPLIRSLADQSGAIVVAPYAGGDDERSGASAEDVYTALDAAEASFAIDRKHVYLVGDGLGGVAAFDVALVRQDAWNGLMPIRSTMDASDTVSYTHLTLPTILRV